MAHIDDKDDDLLERNPAEEVDEDEDDEDEVDEEVLEDDRNWGL